ncbi:hypothetical protein HZ994_01265 [Akkermansiaceae bacterium]|nr:hypothetical protein HZ994_01265 [Akkermansiaceae bacterium]
MSPTPPTLNPSQTVERIREIIVGRHLERLEGRISRLESAPSVMPRSVNPEQFEDRLLVTEARVEALQDHVHRIENSRGDLEATAAMQRQEAQRLAFQIQEIAREKSAATTLPAVENLERKLGAWLVEWQKSINARLESHDRQLAEGLRAELAAIKDGFERRFSELEAKSGCLGSVEERFARIAAAARALAESAASFSNPIPPKA